MYMRIYILRIYIYVFPISQFHNQQFIHFNNHNQESNKELSYNNNTNIFNGGFHRSITTTHINMYCTC